MPTMNSKINQQLFHEQLKTKLKQIKINRAIYFIRIS